MFANRIEMTESVDEPLINKLCAEGEQLLKNKNYYSAELHFKDMLASFPDSEHAKVYLAYALVEQHKQGWAELIADLQVTAFDPYVKALVSNLIIRVGHKFLNHLTEQ